MRLIHLAAAGLLVGTPAFAQPETGPEQGPQQQQAPYPDAQSPSSQGQGYQNQGYGQGPQPSGGYQPGSGEEGPGQQGPRPGAHHGQNLFDMANTTHDGRLTREQAQSGRMMHVAQHFDEIDTDHKGYVTRQDIKAWRTARRQARADRQQQPAQ